MRAQARSNNGEGHAALFVWIVLALFLIALPSAAWCGDTRVDGEFEFFIDKAVFIDSDGNSSVELYLQIPNSEIRFKEKAGAWMARVEFFLELKDLQGGIVLSDKREFDFTESMEEHTVTPLHFQAISMKYSILPGEYLLSSRLVDIYSPKVSLVGMIKKQSKSAEIRALPFEVPAYRESESNLSDPQFVWSIEAAPGKRTLHPNPPRMYGLYNDTLRVYYELYTPANSTGPVQFSSLILNQKGEILAESKKLFSPEEAIVSGKVRGVSVYPILIQEDLTTFPAGDYALFGQFTVGDEQPVRIRGGNFHIAWEMRTWETSMRNLLAEARFLLDPEEYKSYLQESRAEQERIVKQMWKELDPDPETGVNEAYEKFLNRLAYVNRYYSDYQMGIFTDRGLIYMKYGKPDELIVDVIPMNRETTSDAIAKVMDRYHPIVYSTHGSRPNYYKQGTSTDVVMDKRRLGVIGEGGNTAYPYELWVYNDRGDPLLERDSASAIDLGLRFIFIDREGYGSYKLEVSSSLLDEN